ncbi:hypothetical protein SDC9_92790 [bioreactor metagenome]|uniref:Radical SAM core domain-containing protein n=1 Tax=bioreactor metagenome TaxID=1076179 RepID=A0A645A8N2_9ZZZZ
MGPAGNHTRNKESHMAKPAYQGFEVGPIRPPSEHASLLLRITRNCPWNKCKFCTLYKGQSFSVRSTQDVKADIDAIRLYVDFFRQSEGVPAYQRDREYTALMARLGPGGEAALQSAAAWYHAGMESVFLQDANTMVVRPDDLVEILEYLRAAFPEIRRVTSYGRSHTIARISDGDLARIARAGLNRIHIGMESASDHVLALVDKGVDKKTHIEAGRKVKKAGIELSEYYMPGLGGREYARENALETADALNQINPDFIRIRSLAVKRGSLLQSDYERGIFTRANDTDTVRELELFVEHLSGIDSAVKSDHILNLIPELDGTLPRDREAMLAALRWYLALPEEDKVIFRVGRRTGYMGGISDFQKPGLRAAVAHICENNQVNSNTVDGVIESLMGRFI